MSRSKFKYFRSGINGDWYFHLVAGNGKIICQSEGYTRKQACLNGIAAVRRCAPKAKVENVGDQHDWKS